MHLQRGSTHPPCLRQAAPRAAQTVSLVFSVRVVARASVPPVSAGLVSRARRLETLANRVGSAARNFAAAVAPVRTRAFAFKWTTFARIRRTAVLSFASLPPVQSSERAPPRTARGSDHSAPERRGLGHEVGITVKSTQPARQREGAGPNA